MADLAQRFTASSKCLGKQDEQKTGQTWNTLLSLETQITDLGQRFDALSQPLNTAEAPLRIPWKMIAPPMPTSLNC